MGVGSDRDIAIHEAGHAVVGTARGLDMGESKLGPPGRRHDGAKVIGPVHTQVARRHHPTEEELERYSDLARHMWAGPMAEQKHNPQADPSSARDDIAGINKLSEDLFENEIERRGWINDQFCKAADDVDQNWESIEKVADELLKRGLLGPGDVRAIVDSFRN